MKLISVINKSLKEQLRSFWVLILTLSLGPFFIFVYFLITESSKIQYKILIANYDSLLYSGGSNSTHGNNLMAYFSSAKIDQIESTFIVKGISSKDSGINALKNKNADALVVIPKDFSINFNNSLKDSLAVPKIEFYGDLTSSNYLISAIWANEVINSYMLEATSTKRLVEIKETALGSSGNVDYFSMMVPGILIVALIMLMFTASIAFVSEVENKTMLRLKLSKISAGEFVGGITIVQLFVGIVSVILTLFTALALGFKYEGSILSMFFIASLTSLSIISFCLIIAASTKSANEVLIVGNFPMFLFMFFTGAAFPLKSEALFFIAGYPVNIQSLMSPYHAISALNKTLIMNMSLSSIFPEIIAILVLTLFYFAIGGFLFKYRHLRLS